MWESEFLQDECQSCPELKSGMMVVFKDDPRLRGKVLGFLPARDGLPESAVIDVFIPEDHPDFLITGVWENFWCDPRDLIAIQSADESN